MSHMHASRFRDAGTDKSNLVRNLCALHSSEESSYHWSSYGIKLRKKIFLLKWRGKVSLFSLLFLAVSSSPCCHRRLYSTGLVRQMPNVEVNFAKPEPHTFLTQVNFHFLCYVFPLSALKATSDSSHSHECYTNHQTLVLFPQILYHRSDTQFTTSSTWSSSRPAAPAWCTWVTRSWSG